MKGEGGLKGKMERARGLYSYWLDGIERPRCIAAGWEKLRGLERAVMAWEIM